MTRLRRRGNAWCPREALTRGEAGLLVTLGELDVEVGDQRVDVVVPLDLQAEGRGEGQVLALHRVDIHLLHGGQQTVHVTRISLIPFCAFGANICQTVTLKRPLNCRKSIKACRK